MHIGSNDMAQLAQSDPQRAESLALLVVEFARTLVCDHGVKIVILNSMVPWDSTNMRCCAKIFELNINLFNATLLRESEHDACLFYNHMRGFYRQKVNNKDVPLPVSIWSDDGIHVNKQYMCKYLQRIRFAIMKVTATKL